MAVRTGLLARPWGFAATVVGFAGVVVYVVVLTGQNSIPEGLPWILLMTLSTGAALAGSVLEDRSRARRLVVFAALLFFVIGLAGILTIGVIFLAAAVLTTIAATRLKGP